jgi:cell division protein FtsI/penicillin-binding protein 2
MVEVGKIVFYSVTSSVLFIAIALFILKNWFLTHLQQSIKAEYDKQTEIYKRDLDRKEKIDMVAELLAEWIQTETVTAEQRLILNKLSFKSALWLEKDLVVELSKCLQTKPDAQSTFDVVLFARKKLLGVSDLEVSDITYWKRDTELPS